MNKGKKEQNWTKQKRENMTDKETENTPTNRRDKQNKQTNTQIEALVDR